MPKHPAKKNSGAKAAKTATKLNHAGRADKATGGALTRARNFLQSRGLVTPRKQNSGNKKKK